MTPLSKGYVRTLTNIRPQELSGHLQLGMRYWEKRIQVRHESVDSVIVCPLRWNGQFLVIRKNVDMSALSRISPHHKNPISTSLRKLLDPPLRRLWIITLSFIRIRSFQLLQRRLDFPHRFYLSPPITITAFGPQLCFPTRGKSQLKVHVLLRARLIHLPRSL